MKKQKFFKCSAMLTLRHMNNKSRIKIPDKEDNGEVNIEWFINE